MIAEQINIFEISKPKYIIEKPIRLIELFAGVGSQAKALKNLNANFEHYRIVEFDKYAIASYNAIHGTNFEPLDITKITAKDLNIVETDKYEYITTYSFPCQDLSLAGKGAGMKKGSDTRSGLLWEVERILKECKELPQILLMENVPQVISKKNLKDFRKWQLFLEKLGYSNRQPKVVITDKTLCLNSKVNGKQPSLQDRIYDTDGVSTAGDGANKVVENYSKKSLEKIKGNIVDTKGCSKTITANPQRATIDSATLVVVKGNYSPSGHNASRIVDKKGIAPTVMENHGTITAINEELRTRKLTPKECWRLMGWKDEDYEKAQKVNSNSQLYKQAGNSIVVPVLEAIFKELIE